MTSRIHINRPASSYTPTYPSQQPMMGSTGGYRAAPEEETPLQKIQAVATKIEDWISINSQPIKPHLPMIGRLFIVLTFLEDSWRLVTQYGDQHNYLTRYRHIPSFLTHIFLIGNTLAMFGCSTIILLQRYVEYAVAGLLGVVVIQGLGYGLIFDLNYFLRNLSVVGGLIMVFTESMSKSKKSFAGIPSISENDRRKYFQLAGRILLIFLFIGFILTGKWTFVRVIVSILGLAACGMIVAGFKAKWSAAFLVILLSAFNVFVNNWWTVNAAHPTRDFLRYDFFQTLSIVGGLLLLVNMGSGELSVDRMKKEF